MNNTRHFNLVLFLLVALSFLALSLFADLDGCRQIVSGLAIGQWTLILSWLCYTGRLSMARVSLMITALVVLSCATSSGPLSATLSNVHDNTIADQLIIFLLTGVAIALGCPVLVSRPVQAAVCRSSSLTRFGVQEVLALKTLVACLLGLTYQLTLSVGFNHIARSCSIALAIWLAMYTMTRERLWRPVTIGVAILFAVCPLVPQLAESLEFASLLAYLAVAGVVLRIVAPTAARRDLELAINLKGTEGT